MATDVPYEAYKPKRHLRTLSSASTPEPEHGLHPSSANGPSQTHLTVRRFSLQPSPPQPVIRAPSPTPSTSATTASSASSPPSSDLHLDPGHPSAISRPSRFRHVPFRPPPSASQSSPTPPFSRPSPLASNHATSAEPPYPPSPASTPALQVTPPPSRPTSNPPPVSIRESTPSPADPPHRFPSNDSLNPKSVTHCPAASNPTSWQGTARRSTGSGPAPYRAGYQPRGAYADRTDEYLAARDLCRKEGQVERQRLERRLEKIIQLHFLRDHSKPRPQSGRRESSLLSIDFSELKSKSAGNLWRSVLETRLSQSAPQTIREAEQAIVPWQSDKEVSACPICSTSFHPLTNRKHHCRTCGRVVCSGPVKPPVRMRPCSILFVVDAATGCIEEVAEGVDYGVKRRNGQESLVDEKFLKGVRICQDCRPTLLRKQYELDSRAIPWYIRLYRELIHLEKTIEEDIAVYEELLAAELPLPNIQSMRESLLANLADYENLAKEIRHLPINGEIGGSQDRIQKSIAVRAGLFLQKKMLPLKIPIKESSPHSDPDFGDSGVGPLVSDPNADLASKLQPLLEQEAILESFVEEARARRKFDDVQSLTSSLKEIRAEIIKLSQIAA